MVEIKCLNRQGSSVEELTIQVNKAKAKLDLVERDLKSMALLNKACFRFSPAVSPNNVVR